MAVPSWFDWKKYFENKADQMGTDPLALKPLFENAGYAYSAEGMYDHFEEFGNAENISPSSWFDVDKYLFNKAADFYDTPQVTAGQIDSMKQAFAASGLSAWDHYCQFWTEDGFRDPSLKFDASKYMEDKLAELQKDDPSFTMSDLVEAFQASGLNPITHYVSFGKAEGLVVSPAPMGSTGTEIKLVDGDNYGTAGNDYFYDRSYVLDDDTYIDGKDGHDTLYALVKGVASVGMGISPMIENVETILFRAQNTSTVGGGDNNPGAYIDAGDIKGMTLLGSDNSRADLSVEDVRIDSNKMTIRFADSDSGGVDFNVYFHPQYLKSDDAVTSGKLYAQLIDTVGALPVAQGGHADPLYDNPYTGFKFTLNGKSYTLDFKAYNHETDPTPTYAELAVQMQAAIDADATLSTLGLEVVTGDPFTAVVGIGDYKGTVVNGTQIVISSSQGELVGGNWIASNGLPPTNSTSATFTEHVDTTCPLIRTTVELDNVGQVMWEDARPECLPDNIIYGSNSGDLVIGSGAQRGGIERFDLKVDEGSWLSALASTNNALRMITVEARDIDGDGTSGGQLYIGDWLGLGDQVGNNGFNFAWTDAARLLTATQDRAGINQGGLVDVAVFDATGYAGDINIAALVTVESFDKYLKSVDGERYIDKMYAPLAAEAYAGAFSYFTGNGDDVVNMSVNGSIAADVDFKMNIDTGAGEDLVAFRYTDMTNNQSLNQKNLQNVEVNTGAGDDTVWFYGAGVDFTPAGIPFLQQYGGSLVINTGAGNDVIYANQKEFFTGGVSAYDKLLPADTYNAVFVFNTGDRTLASDWGVGGTFLQGATLNNDMAVGLDTFGVTGAVNGEALYVEVTFKGQAATFKIVDVSTGLTSVTAEQINHAIINAIENDDVLSNLIVAKDGAGHTLLIESLINGLMTANDLDIAFYAAKADGTAGVTVLNDLGWYATKFGQGTDSLGAIADYVGSNSASSQVIVDAGAGDDIIVLGPNSAPPLPGLKDVVVLSPNFGNDTLVGFRTGEDVINLAGFLDPKTALNTTAAVGALVNNAAIVYAPAPGATAPTGIFTQAEVTKLVTAGTIKLATTAGNNAVVFLHDTNADGMNVYTIVHVTTTSTTNTGTVMGSMTLDAVNGVAMALTAGTDFALDSVIRDSITGLTLNTVAEYDAHVNSAGTAIEGTLFDDVFNDLGTTAPTAATVIDGKQGNDTFNITAGTLGTITSLLGGEGNDTFNIKTVAGFTDAGGEIINGGTGTDALKIDAAVTGAVTLANMINVESVVHAGSGALTLTAAPALQSVNITDAVGTAALTLTAAASTNLNVTLGDYAGVADTLNVTFNTDLKLAVNNFEAGALNDVFTVVASGFADTTAISTFNTINQTVAGTDNIVILTDIASLTAANFTVTGGPAATVAKLDVSEDFLFIVNTSDANNGTMYQVSTGAADADTVVTLVGTIDLQGAGVLTDLVAGNFV